MATRKPAVTHEEMIAAIAELSEQVRHLVEDGRERETRILQHLASEGAEIRGEVEKIRAVSTANAEFIKSIKLQSATWAVAISGFGVMVWQAVTFLWDKVQMR